MGDKRLTVTSAGVGVDLAAADVTTELDVNGTVRVRGNMDVWSTLRSHGTFAVDGDLTVANGFHVDDLVVAGEVQANDLTTRDLLNVTTTLDSPVLFASAGAVGVNKGTPAVLFDVVGSGTVSETFRVMGSASVTGDVTLDGSMDVSGDATAGSVDAATSIDTDSVSAVSTTTTGDVTVDGGVLKTSSGLGSVGINTPPSARTLDVLGETAIAGDVAMDASLSVADDLTLDGRLDILAGKLSVSRRLELFPNRLVVDDETDRVGVNRDIASLGAALDIDGSLQCTVGIQMANLDMAQTMNALGDTQIASSISVLDGGRALVDRVHVASVTADRLLNGNVVVDVAQIDSDLSVDGDTISVSPTQVRMGTPGPSGGTSALLDVHGDVRAGEIAIDGSLAVNGSMHLTGSLNAHGVLRSAGNVTAGEVASFGTMTMARTVSDAETAFPLTNVIDMSSDNVKMANDLSVAGSGLVLNSTGDTIGVGRLTASVSLDIEGNMTVTGKYLSAPGFDIELPLYTVIMWSRPLSELPENFQLADGTNGCPNITDTHTASFDVRGGTVAVDETTGPKSDFHMHTETVAPTTIVSDQLPKHDHQMNHTHTIQHPDADEPGIWPKHRHQLTLSPPQNTTVAGSKARYGSTGIGQADCADPQQPDTTSQVSFSSYADGIGPSAGNSDYAGGGQAHNHNLVIDNSTHVMLYHSLYFVCKIA